MRQLLPLVVLGVLRAPALTAQEAHAVRAPGPPPVIDGRLDDDAWEHAPPVTQFVQRNPDEGRAATESTEVRFVYTDRDLYVAFRGYDRESGRVFGRLVRRDQRTASDYFNLFIDSYYDRRTAFEFAINPSGARRDVFIYDDGGGRDESWDPVYAWATHRDSLGWTVELRIPFSQLRFPAADTLVFGLRLRRAINRRNEDANWPFFPRDQAGEVSRYGRLVGLRDIPAPRRVELLPYTAGSAAFAPPVDGDPFRTGEELVWRAGSDFKVGVTSGLTLDATVNPDFGQVEADPAVVNLTAFESFFPEKRPFFVEGSNLFQLGLQPSQRGGEGGFRTGGEEGLVYTRRIGRAPQVSPEVAGGYAEPLSETTILGAAKLSGQLAGGWAVGVAQALTGKESATIVDSAGNVGSLAVEPMTSYTVVRAQRATRRGRLAYGTTVTGVVRRLDEVRFARLHERAFSGGTDLSVRFGGDRYELDVALLGSRVEGSPEALVRTQRSAARYYQRPDNDYATLDRTRTALMGAAGYLRLAKRVGFVAWELRYSTRSPGFEVNDLGFQRQADVHQQQGQIGFRWLRPGRVFRQFEIQLKEQVEFTYGWERTRASSEVRVSGDFLNYWSVTIGAERRFAALGTRLLRGGPAVLEPGAWDVSVGGRTDFRRPLWVNARVSHTREDLSGIRTWNANAGVGVRPPGGFGLQVNGNVRWDADDRQYLATGTAADSTYYVLGRLERREVSLTVRADMAITPRLSVELYAQPFASSGRYPVLKVAAAPRAARYADRFDVLGPDRVTRPGGDRDVAVDVDRSGTVDVTFDEPNFTLVSLRTNAVLRWEFLPGSTLYVVWQQDRRDRTREGILRVPEDMGRAFSASGTNVLAVKIAYWVG